MLDVCMCTRIGRRNAMKISFHKCMQHKIYKIFIYAKWYVHLESSQLKGHVYDKMQIPRAIVVGRSTALMHFDIYDVTKVRTINGFMLITNFPNANIFDFHKFPSLSAQRLTFPRTFVCAHTLIYGAFRLQFMRLQIAPLKVF